jgi:hypothetical protein
LESKKRERDEKFQPSKKSKGEFDDILKEYNITEQDLEKDKLSVLKKFCYIKI